MASDYRAITQHNEARLGADISSRKTQISMFTNPTQFVYELLQNAEDCGASKVSFSLLGDAVAIEHNGRSFKEIDVKRITYFGTGTTPEDFVKVGRSGIGFKSVFALTATPIIISRDEHFKIYDLYRIREYPYPEGFSETKTLIVLPFNHTTERPVFVEEQVSPIGAYARTQECLTAADVNMLLFSKNVRKITWKIYPERTRYFQQVHSLNKLAYIDAAEQKYSRINEVDPINSGSLEIQHLEGGEDRIVAYGDSRFSSDRPSQPERSYYRFAKPVSIEGESANSLAGSRISIAFAMKQEKIIPLEQGQVFTPIPAAKEISGLHFHIQAPFASTVSRDSLLTCETNDKLRDQIANLIAESVHTIRDKGLLDTEFLAVLPNGKDRLSTFYEPIRERLVEEFKTEKLVPMKQIGHAAASECYRGSRNTKDISELIKDDDLGTLLVERNRVSSEVLRFVNNYCLLNSEAERALAQEGSIESKKRLVEANLRVVIFILHKEFRGYGIPADFLFNAGQDGLINAVDRYVPETDGRLHAFAKDYIRQTIQNYIDTTSVPMSALWIKNPQINSRADNFLSLLDIPEWTIDDFMDILSYPTNDYILNWFKNKWDGWYTEFYEFLGHFLAKKPLYRGAKIAECVVRLLVNGSWISKGTERSKLVWKTMIFLHEHRCTKINWPKKDDSKPNFKKVDIKALYERAVCQAKKMEWVPQKEKPKTFVLPSKASVDYLPEGFPYEAGQKWLEDIGFAVMEKENREKDKAELKEIKEICKEQEITLDDAKDILKGTKPLIEQKQKPLFPDMPATRPTFWDTRFAEELADVPLSKWERPVKSIRIDIATEYTRAWLRANYKNSVGQMVCQMCESEMPLKKLDGEYHFEAVPIFTKTYLGNREHAALHLALCPLCAATYREFVWQNWEVMIMLTMDLVGNDSLQIPLPLNTESSTLRFVDRHKQVLKDILAANV